MVATEPERPTGSASTATVPAGAVAATRRFFESVVIAVLTSTGLYLVGSVYTDAYYGRMSIDSNSLDLSPTFIGLQAMHVLPGLLSYPSALLTYYLLYRFLFSRGRWLRGGYDRLRQRFQRAVLLVTNLLVIAPLVVDSILAISERGILGNSAVSELSVLLSNVIIVLLGYVVWLSFGPRALLFSEVRHRRVIPILLVGFAYLLSALITTADTGAEAAEIFMLGLADTSIAIELTLRDERQAPSTDVELLLVTARHGNYFLVERQTSLPATRPNAYIVPFDAVDFAHVRRVTPAQVELEMTEDEFVGIDLDFEGDDSGDVGEPSPAP